jgi:Na+-driven multidrug efflux pump
LGKFILILEWAIGLTLCFVYRIYAAGPALPGLFTDDAALVESTRGPLRLVAALQPLNAAVFVGDGVLQGAADFDCKFIFIFIWAIGLTSCFVHRPRDGDGGVGGARARVAQ